MGARRRNYRAITLMEVLIASALLAVALVPIFQVLTRGMTLARDVQLRTTAAFLAEKEMETALATAVGDFGIDLTKSSEDLGDGYLVTVNGVDEKLRKTFSVQVGWDTDGDGTLDGDEVLVTFATRAANTTEDVGG
jgi:type II secretory pathway component PulJ